MSRINRKGGFSLASLLILVCVALIIIAFFLLPAFKNFEMEGDIGGVKTEYKVDGIDYIRAIFDKAPDALDILGTFEYSTVKSMINTGDGMDLTQLIFAYTFFGTACVAVIVALLSLITTFCAGILKKLIMAFSFLLMAGGISVLVCALLLQNSIEMLGTVQVCVYIMAVASVASFVISMMKRSSK